MSSSSKNVITATPAKRKRIPRMVIQNEMQLGNLSLARCHRLHSLQHRRVHTRNRHHMHSCNRFHRPCCASASSLAVDATESILAAQALNASIRGLVLLEKNDQGQGFEVSTFERVLFAFHQRHGHAEKHVYIVCGGVLEFILRIHVLTRGSFQLGFKRYAQGVYICNERLAEYRPML
ncbi:hypothetical protein BC830DRAFT_624038 [Chytriomyces sp. MP71]|nr:hypothetical protein BC830DRAFT_624038 [Chytriomyces sp. MP71]